jgi:hypothetical protein
MGGPQSLGFAILVGMSHAPLAAATSHYPAPIAGGYPAYTSAQPNPEGMAAIGSVVGALVASGLIGSAVAMALKAPAAEVDVEAEDVTQEEMQGIMKQEFSALRDEWKTYLRKRQAIKWVLGTLGSAVGAYVGAGPQSNRTAAAGYAALGTGAVRAINVAVPMPMGFPGYLTGALGAYYGAKKTG